MKNRTIMIIPADGSHTHFTAMWADPKDMVRPAYNPDITSAVRGRISEEWNT